MPDIRLIPLTASERERFIEEEVANYADQQIRDAGWPRTEALGRARAELMPVLERELGDAADRGHRLWSAIEPDGRSVGWLWVKPGDDAKARGAFLYQITVAARRRRRGYGRAMLTALEDELARGGVEVLHLNVNVGNAPARRLYASAGYELVGENERVCSLRKRLPR
jgi:ribosomal protein S18 acetylase RimI-like enzyme